MGFNQEDFTMLEKIGEGYTLLLIRLCYVCHLFITETLGKYLYL